MIKIAIVTDGPYGERAYENIKEEFETEFIELEPPVGAFIDEIEVPEDALEKLTEAECYFNLCNPPGSHPGTGRAAP